MRAVHADVDCCFTHGRVMLLLNRAYSEFFLKKGLFRNEIQDIAQPSSMLRAAVCCLAELNPVSNRLLFL